MKQIDLKQYFFISSLLYIAVYILLFQFGSIDSYGIYLSDNIFQDLVNAEFSSGRYTNVGFLHFAKLISLDPISNIPVYAALAAISAGLFLKQLYLNYYRFVSTKTGFACFCFAFLFSGSMLDLLSFSEATYRWFIMFAACYVYLTLDDMKENWPQALLKGLTIVIIFGIYQPAVVMLLTFSIMRCMFALANGDAVRLAAKRFVLDALLFFLCAIGYIVLKIFIEKSFGTQITRSLIDFNDFIILKARAAEHLRAIGQLFVLSGGMYKWGHIGVVMVLAISGFVSYVLFTKKMSKSSVLAILLTTLLVALSQNPMNFIVSTYWPTLRSSFYVALIPPILVAYLYSKVHLFTCKSSVPSVILIGFVFLYGVSALAITADAYELRKRDFALAQKFAAEINANSNLEGVTKLRIPEDWSGLLRDYYHGINQIGFDLGAPALLAPWAVGPFMRLATGMSLVFDGRSTCDAVTRHPKIQASLKDGAINICYR